MNTVLRDTWSVFRHTTRIALRQKVGIAFGVLQPMLYLVLFGPLFATIGTWEALSNAIALTLNPEAFAPVMSTGTVPLILLSGAFLPMSMAPGWLDALSRMTPFRYVLEAVRDLFGGRYATWTVAAGVAVTLLLSVVCVTAGTRVFNRENA